MKTKLEKLEAKIRELCPELMELREGCQILIDDGRTMYFGLDEIESKVIKEGEKKIYTREWYAEGDYGLVRCKNEVEKIIGHPIRLEHVLRTLALAGENWDEIRNGVCCFEIEQKKTFIELETHSDHSACWHFGKPWESQTETHELLFRILNIE